MRSDKPIVDLVDLKMKRLMMVQHSIHHVHFSSYFPHCQAHQRMYHSRTQRPSNCGDQLNDSLV